MNRVTLVGRLARDPELRSASSGMKVCRMRIAIPRRKRGTQEDPGAVFIDVIAFERLAEACASYLANGSQVSVDGRLEHRTREADDGSSRSVYEVIAQEVRFLDPAPKRTGQERPAEPPHGASPAGGQREQFAGASS